MKAPLLFYISVGNKLQLKNKPAPLKEMAMESRLGSIEIGDGMIHEKGVILRIAGIRIFRIYFHI